MMSGTVWMYTGYMWKVRLIVAETADGWLRLRAYLGTGVSQRWPAGGAELTGGCCFVFGRTKTGGSG